MTDEEKIKVRDLGPLRLVVVKEALLGPDGEPVLDEDGNPVEGYTPAEPAVQAMANLDHLQGFIKTMTEELRTLRELYKKPPRRKRKRPRKLDKPGTKGKVKCRP